MSTTLIGHERQITYLDKARSRDRLAHAYLFYGPEHVGKLTVALALAQSFFCETTEKPDMRSACGHCVSCRAIDECRHPNVAVLDTSHTLVSKKESRREIPIEDIRELKRIFSFAPQGTMMRLAIINEAEKMSEEAANAFLKLLEEPGTRTLIILIAPSRDILLPTIVSRTQPVGFSTVPASSLKALLAEKCIPAEKHDEMLALAAGRPGVLMRLCDDAAFAKEERKLFGDIQAAVRDRDMLSCLRISESVAGDTVLRERASSFLLGQLHSALIAAPSDDSALMNAKKIKRIDRIVRLMDSTNINPRLGTDVMFLEALGLSR